VNFRDVPSIVFEGAAEDDRGHVTSINFVSLAFLDQVQLQLPLPPPPTFCSGSSLIDRLSLAFKRDPDGLTVSHTAASGPPTCNQHPMPKHERRRVGTAREVNGQQEWMKNLGLH
jgi:hypothetical protein